MGGLNPRWNEDSSNERADAQFQKAVQLTGSEFMESVDYLAKVGFFCTTATLYLSLTGDNCMQFLYTRKR